MPRDFRFFLTAFLASFLWMSVAPVPAYAADASLTHASAAAPDAATTGGVEKAGIIPNDKQFPWQILTALLSFTAVFFIMATQIWPRITKGLDERAAKIREEIDAAEEARAQARAALQDYEKSLAEARADAQKMIDQARAQQAEVAKDLRNKTEAEMVQMRERAMRDIDSARRAAVEQIHSEAVALGTMIASSVLEREVSADDQDRLLSDSIAKLRSTRA
jgi:F-type H+-transporting ATPase subunit b